VLLTEPRWVALPESHRLTASTQIAFADLADEQFIWTSRSAAPPKLASGEITGWQSASARAARSASEPSPTRTKNR
jgi:hypothetical protein